jgi:hypothetical protein
LERFRDISQALSINVSTALIAAGLTGAGATSASQDALHSKIAHEAAELNVFSNAIVLSGKVIG